MTTSKELINKTLEFRNNERVPRQLWYLPWAEIHYPDELTKIRTTFPDDIDSSIDAGLKEQPKTEGDMHEVGEATDVWGAKFQNKLRGIIGEVKEPIIAAENWEDASNAHIPYELLTIDSEKINKQCAESDKFMLAGECPRPFEQLQFLRGTESLYIDLILKPKGMFDFIGKMHDFYCEWVEAWAQTDVDGIMMMDDWGSQRSLLINPREWKEIFRPMYRDYINIAKKYNKKTFMHSDGFTLDIIPELIDLGLDAINSQIFCIGLDKLEQFKGKITFWGEIDRQEMLVHGTKKEIEDTVKDVYDKLWDNGGCIAQCEFGPAANPQNVYTVFEAWNKVK